METKKIRKIYIILITGMLILMLGGCASMVKNQTGLQDGAFLPCPDSPNCVSSMTEDSDHSIDPISYTDMTREEAILLLTKVIELEDNSIITFSEDSYIHAEFRSSFFRFVDDVEFFFPQDEQIIHVKSASRVGYSDFGVNRKRVEHLREVFHAFE